MNKIFMIKNVLYGYKDRILGNEIISGQGDLPFIFLHIPKAAGMSITKSLYGEEIGHRTIRYYKAYYGNRLLEKYTFSIVRNPWDRLFSAYTFLMAGGMDKYNSDIELGLYLNENYPSFEEFVIRGLDDYKVMSYIHFIPQYMFIALGGKVYVDFLGRFENLKNDFDTISDNVGKKVILSHINKTKKDVSYRDVYSAMMIDKVSKVYAIDIKLLGYEF